MTTIKRLIFLILIVLLAGCGNQSIIPAPAPIQANTAPVDDLDPTDPPPTLEAILASPTPLELTPTDLPEPTITPLPVEENQSPPGIILFIGDGMGAAHRQAATWLALGKDGRLAMDSLSVQGWAQTAPLGGTVTDSAAAGTALATGQQSSNRVISMDASGNPLTTILEMAEQQGWATGLVTTVTLAHATPAVFAAHQPDRGDMKAIARQMIASNVEILLGGGEDDFFSADENGCYPGAGYQPKGEGLVSQAIAQGYTYLCNREELLAVNASPDTKLIGLFAADEIPTPFSPSLAEMTQAALSVLSQDPDGFFLMVEAGQIDWAAHGMKAEEAMQYTIGLDTAVTMAMIFTIGRENTLLIVTADHETGGMNLNLDGEGGFRQDGPFHMPDGTSFWVDWTGTHHTAVNIPVTAQGPNAEMLAGEYHLTHIFEVMAAMLESNH